jgi:hypothetical protein
VALESAIGGMLLSVIGMSFAAIGMLPPVAGAVAQEAIDLLAVLNALRTARQPARLTDFDAGSPGRETRSVPGADAARTNVTEADQARAGATS